MHICCFQKKNTINILFSHPQVFMKKIIIALLAISTMIAFAETVRPIDSASTVSDISTASSLDTSVRTDTPAENIQIPLDTVFDEDFPLMRDQESSGFMSELSTPQGIFGIIIVGMIYIIVPLLFYIISSWSMARIDGFYNRFSKKWVFWIPFFRMYTLIKNATKS